jgi:hypothetical protein
VIRIPSFRPALGPVELEAVRDVFDGRLAWPHRVIDAVRGFFQRG